MLMIQSHWGWQQSKDDDDDDSKSMMMMMLGGSGVQPRPRLIMRGIKRGEKFKGSSSNNLLCYSATATLLLLLLCFCSTPTAAAATAENFSRLRPKAPHPATAPAVHVGWLETRGSRTQTQNTHLLYFSLLNFNKFPSLSRQLNYTKKPKIKH